MLSLLLFIVNERRASTTTHAGELLRGRQAGPQPRLGAGYPYTGDVGHITNAVRARTSPAAVSPTWPEQALKWAIGPGERHELASGYERPIHTAAVSGSRPEVDSPLARFFETAAGCPVHLARSCPRITADGDRWMHFPSPRPTNSSATQSALTPERRQHAGSRPFLAPRIEPFR